MLGFFLACSFVGGLGHGVKNVMFRSLIHVRVPDRLHGRAFAAYNGIRNGAELGALHAASYADYQPQSPTSLWAALAATAHARWVLVERLVLDLSGGVLFPLVRTRFYFEPDDTLTVVPAVTGRLALSLGFRL